MSIQTRVPLASIFIAFGMLWIPLGQHDFLVQHWMKVGFFMAPFLVLVAGAVRAESSKEHRFDLSFLSLLLLVAYIVHQFEEHWIDLFGNRYAFRPYLNQLLIERFGPEGQSEGPLSDVGVFVINTSLVWLVGAIAILRASARAFPALCMASIVVTNAFSHIVAGIFTFSYNPGLLTAALLFVPLGLTAYAYSLRSGACELRLVSASLIWGVLAHIIMIAGMIASGWFGIISESLYFGLLIVWSIVPVFLYRKPIK